MEIYKKIKDIWMLEMMHNYCDKCVEINTFLSWMSGNSFHIFDLMNWDALTLTKKS